MLKTNSKKARENVRRYVMEHIDVTNYECDGMMQPETFKDAAQLIYYCFRSEFWWGNQKQLIPNEQNAFEYWCSGLPSIIDTCYYYNRSAVDDLSAILEETESEKQRFSERDAEKLLTYLIYREVSKEA